MSSSFPSQVRQGLQTRCFGQRIVYLPSTPSTNDVAKDLASQGEPEGTVVLAGEQTAGKGRLGRTWYSPKGGSVLLSILFRPQLPPSQLFLLTMLTASGTCGAIEETTGLRCHLKWPNDLQVGDRKVGGILAEVSLAGDTVDFAVVGVGLNVNMDVSKYPDIRDLASSLSREMRKRVSRAPLIQSMLRNVERRYELLGSEQEKAVFEEWRSRLNTLGKRVTLTDSERVEQGLAVDVASDGALLIQRDDGSVFRAVAGDVSLRAVRL